MKVTGSEVALGVAGRTSQLTTAGLLAALMCASAWVAIPTGSVPATLQVFVVLLTALLLSPAWAGAAMGVYLLLGALGAPVFSAGQGGFGVLAGPTGGYLVGFLLGALCGSWVRLRLNRVAPAAGDVAAAAVCLAVVYAVGTVWLARVANLTALQAFAAGVAPFIALDVAKGIAAIAVAAAVRRARGRAS